MCINVIKIEDAMFDLFTVLIPVNLLQQEEDVIKRRLSFILKGTSVCCCQK